MAKKALIGAGIVAGAALAAYLLTSPKDRKKAAAKVKGWMESMKKDVASRAKKVKDLSKAKYEEIVEDVMPKYETLKDVSSTELDNFSKELKSHWNNVSKGVAKTKKAGSSKKK